MGKIVVRKMQKGDLSVVSRLAMLANPHAKKTEYTLHLEHELNQSPELAFVAVEDEEVVGYVMDETHEDHAILEDIVVDEARQDQGVGAMLLETELKAIKTAKPEIIVAEVHYKCASAIPFYYKHGFRISGVCRNFFGMRHDAIILELILRETEQE